MLKMLIASSLLVGSFSLMAKDRHIQCVLTVRPTGDTMSSDIRREFKFLSTDRNDHSLSVDGFTFKGIPTGGPVGWGAPFRPSTLDMTLSTKSASGDLIESYTHGSFSNYSQVLGLGANNKEATIQCFFELPEDQE